MPRKRRWSELSERTRRSIILAGCVEGVLKVLALIDLKRRPADEIRGSKTRWAAAILIVNSGGAAPIAYLVCGRRNRGHPS